MGKRFNGGDEVLVNGLVLEDTGEPDEKLPVKVVFANKSWGLWPPRTELLATKDTEVARLWDALERHEQAWIDLVGNCHATGGDYFTNEGFLVARGDSLAGQYIAWAKSRAALKGAEHDL